MGDAKEIYSEIGRLLSSMAPPEAAVMVFMGFQYVGHDQGGPHWIREDGSIGRFTRELRMPLNDVDGIKELMWELGTKEPFVSDEPFTHYKIELTHDMKFSIDFAHIPEEQSWPNVFMKPVGSLTEDEAKALFVPHDHWLIRKRLLEGEIGKDEFDAEITRLEGAFDTRRAAQ